MAAGVPGRTTAAHRKNRRELRALGLHCWICGQPINYEAHKDDPDSFEYDHAKSIKAHPELADDPANGRPSHKRCNGTKGAGEMLAGIGTPSEEW